MDVSSMLACAVLAVLISGVSHGSEDVMSVGTPDDCVSNCVSIVRYPNNLLVLARNKEGQIFKTLSFELPSGARRIGGGLRKPDAGVDFGDFMTGVQMLSDVPTGGVCGGYTGVCTETALIRYETTTHVIIYTFTFVFNDGELVEVRVDETRVAQSKLQ